MEQLIASVTIAFVLLGLVLRDVLVDHGRVVRATWSERDDAPSDDVLPVDGGGEDVVVPTTEAAAAA